MLKRILVIAIFILSICSTCFAKDVPMIYVETDENHKCFLRLDNALHVELNDDDKREIKTDYAFKYEILIISDIGPYGFEILLASYNNAIDVNKIIYSNTYDNNLRLIKQNSHTESRWIFPKEGDVLNKFNIAFAKSVASGKIKMVPYNPM